MKPLTRFATVACVVFLIFPAFLANPARADDAPKAPTAGKCMMWTVSSKTATVYLLGSMHMATRKMYPLPTEVEDAFAKSDILTVEININKLDQAKLMRLVQEKGMYQGAETLPGSIKPETWQQTKDACTKIGLPPEGVEKMKPWLVSVSLATLQSQKLGLDPKLGVDQHFLDLAGKQGKPIDELETAEFQISTFANFDAKLQEEQLVLTLAENKNLRDDLTRMTDAWLTGNPAGIEKLFTKNLKDHPETGEVLQKLIYDRNVPMTEKVEAYLKGNKTVFLVVGCAHLVGDKGIVKLLQNDNFTVEQSTATRPAKEEKQPVESVR